MDKKNIQEKDLENVSGGMSLDNEHVYCTCKGCGTEFDLTNTQYKFVKNGCGHNQYYKCPGCGKWVDPNGKVQG